MNPRFDEAEAKAIELGWWAVEDPERPDCWHPVPQETEGAVPDANRVLREREEQGDDKPPLHAYLSTSCYHGIHDECRLVCKHCPQPCHCTCHQEQK